LNDLPFSIESNSVPGTVPGFSVAALSAIQDLVPIAAVTLQRETMTPVRRALDLCFRPSSSASFSQLLRNSLDWSPTILQQLI
jgi:hypothetical protein